MTPIRNCHLKTLESFGLERLEAELKRLKYNHKTDTQILGSLRIPVMMSHGCTPEYAENALWAYLSRYDYKGDLRDTMVSLEEPSLINPRISHRAGMAVPEMLGEAMEYLSVTPYRVNLRMARLLRSRTDSCALLAEIERVGAHRFFTEVFLDWRGRVYYDSRGQLNHQGDDKSRSLVEMAEALPVTMEDLMFFLDVIEDEYDLTLERIWEIAEDPEAYLDNNTDSKPYCTCAAALAYVEAVETGESRYILQQDASCSGFQHMAFLLRDATLGKLVNILPSRGKRRDLYKMVIRRLLRNSKKTWVTKIKKHGFDVLRKELAKKTVILTGYGSGSKPLALKFAGYQPTNGEATYEEVKSMIEMGEPVVLQPMACLKEVLEGMSQVEILQKSLEIAKEMQDILFDIAPSIKSFIRAMRGRAVSVYNKSDGKETFSWTTPLGMDISLLGYRVNHNKETHEVCTTIDGQRHRKRLLTMVEDNCASQAPPCYVHSFDAAVIHLMSLMAKAQGISLAPIHDSVGTHVCHARWARKAYTKAMILIHSHTWLNETLKASGGKEMRLGTLRLEQCATSQMVF